MDAGRTLKRLFSPDPWQCDAAAALKEVRKAGASAKAQVAADAFARVEKSAGDDGSRLVARMTRAAATAAGDADSATRAYEAGLKTLAAGAAAAAGPVAEAALRLIHAGYRSDTSQNQTRIADAVLRTAAQGAPDAHLRAQAALLVRTADAAKYWDSSLDGLEAALTAMSGAGDYLGLLAWHMVRGDAVGAQAFEKARRGHELRALGLVMSEAGSVTDMADDRRAMALEAVSALADAADPTARMAKVALGSARYGATTRAIAQASLQGRVGTTVARLASTAHEAMDAAYAGQDGSRWVDEKTPVASACLDFIASEADDERQRHFAAMAWDIVQGDGFTKSGVAVSELAFDALRGKLGDERVASFVLDAVKKSIAGDNSSYKYVDDQSPAARLGAELLAKHGTTEDVRHWGELACAALSPSKFTKSNVGIAKAVFPMVGERFDDVSLARVGAKMLDGSLNSESSAGRFQADKSTVARALLPFMESHLTDEGAKRVRAMWEKAVEDVHFADTTDRVSHVALDAIASGRASDRDLARLAGKMVDKAYAGTTSSYAYEDDKTGVALRTARWLSTEARDANVKAAAKLFLEAMDRVTFTDTCEKISDLAFDAMADGTPLDDAAIARLGRKMVGKALATTNSAYHYVDDKTVVALNVLDAVTRATKSEDTRTMVAVVRSGLRQAQYTKSTVAVADLGLKAVSRGKVTRKDIADVALDAIRAGIVADGKQDKGPIAVGVFGALSGAETKSAQAAAALDTVRAMMDTNADYTDRVRVAEAALERWSAGTAADALDLVRGALPAAKDDAARRTMLGAAVVRIAADRDDQERQDAAQVVARTRSSNAAADCDYLLGFVEELRKRPSRGVDVEKMADRLNQGPRATDPRVENADDYVVIAGVRVRKRQ